MLAGSFYVGTANSFEACEVWKAEALPPVGGIWIPINRFEFLAPWIGLASLIIAAAVPVGYVKRRKKKQT